MIAHLAGYLLECPYFKEICYFIAVHLSKQEAFDANPKARQQINFNGNLEHAGNTFFILEELNEIILDFSQKNIRNCDFILI